MRALRSVLVVSLLALPTLVLASEGGAHHEEHHGIPWATLIFSAINFGLFIFLMSRLAWPSIRDWVSTRHAAIVQTLEQAERAKREAEQLKQEWERRLSGLQTEIDALRAQARADIAREREHMMAAAQRTADSIRRDAVRAAEQEQRAAQALLRDEVARRALALATERARKELTAADHDRFIGDFLKQVRS